MRRALGGGGRRAALAALTLALAGALAACGRGEEAPRPQAGAPATWAVDEEEALREGMRAHLRAGGFRPGEGHPDDPDALVLPAGGEACRLVIIHVDPVSQPHSLYDPSGRVAVQVTDEPRCLEATAAIVDTFDARAALAGE